MEAEQLLILFSARTARFTLALSLIRPFRAIIPFSGRLAACGALAAAGLLPPPPAAEEFSAILCVLQELLLGLLSAAPPAIALECFGITGRLIDSARGAQTAEQLNPQLGTQESLIEQLGMYGTSVLLLIVFGENLAETVLCAAPPEPLGAGELRARAGAGARLFGSALTQGVCLAWPVLILAMMIDLFSALASRLLGRVNLLFELLPAKLLLGIVLLWWFAWAQPGEGPQAVLFKLLSRDAV